jgi:hypothetical protein
MAISWTKLWSSDDDGSIPTGTQIGTMQNDITTGVATTVAVSATFLLDSVAQTVYCVSPVAGNVVAAYVNNYVAARGAAYTVTNGSAGTGIASVTVTSTGVAGSVTSMTLGTVAVTVGSSIGITRAAQGTTGASQVTVVITASS